MSPTSWTLYNSNEDAWSAMLADCAKAEKSIELEQFIYVADEIGQKLIDICAKRAAAGVKVRFLWDAGGSFSFFGSNIVADLRKKGIELVFWKTLIPSYYKFQDFRSWYLRNHRRTLVIDGEIGYTGSICMRKEGFEWRDTNARFEGPIVAEMENAFERMWARAKKQKPLPKRFFANDPEFRYVTSYPAPGRRHIYSELTQAIRDAENSIDITTPYFIPPHRVIRLLKSSVKRGVQVRLILPSETDDYIIDLACRSYFTNLLEGGVKIFQYKGNILHGKSSIIDGKWSTVGTLNLDYGSLLYNFEANIISKNTEFAAGLSVLFEEDLKVSKELNLPEWKRRSFMQKLGEFSTKLIRKML